MSLKLCEPKNILEKKGVLMLRHICYDTNGSALKASGTLMVHWRGYIKNLITTKNRRLLVLDLNMTVQR